MTDRAAMRAGDRDREATVAVLREAYAEGRLNLAELQARVENAYTAQTWDQLGILTADIPRAQRQTREVEWLRAPAASPAPGRLAAAVLVSGLAVLGIVTAGWAPAVIVLAALLMLAAAWVIHGRQPRS